MSDVMVGTPTRTNVHAEYARSLARDIGLLSSNAAIVRGVHVEDNRMRIWDEWQDREERFLLMVDSDVSWERGTIGSLINAIRNYSTPIAFPDLRLSWHETSAFMRADNFAPAIPAPFSTEPFLCDAFAAGMVLFSRELLSYDALQEKPWRRLPGRTEDDSFSFALSRAKIRPVCVPLLDVVHWSIPHAGLLPRTC